MMLFELKERAKDLSLFSKMWMYPMAHVLSAAAKSVVWAVDAFNVATFRQMIKE